MWKSVFNGCESEWNMFLEEYILVFLKIYTILFELNLFLRQKY